MHAQIREIEVKSVMTKSNLPVSDFSVNPYVGCAHACQYCYASFMKRFTGHTEPSGEFVDVKFWPPRACRTSATTTSTAPFGEPPVVVNYFYHEEVKKSAKRGA